MTKKIVLIGRAGTGKTSIKQAIFEGINPKELIIKPLEPTRGIITNIYSWMDVELSLFDTSGQELPFLLENENERNIAFEQANVIIYVFDYPYWTIKSEVIMEEIRKVFRILKTDYITAQFLLFFHKVDLLGQKLSIENQVLKAQIQNKLNLPEDLKIYFTSLHPNLIFNLINAFSEILSNLSTETSKLKNILDIAINQLPKTICFVINQNNNIIVQSKTNDFDSMLINDLQKRIAKVDQSSGNFNEIYNKYQFIDSGPKILRMLTINIEHLNPNFKQLICISEILDMLRLKKFIDKLNMELKKKYNSKMLK